MLLTDDEIEQIVMDDNGRDCFEFARAVEAAILAKLASAELPEPVVIDMHVSGYVIRGYKKDQLRQAYAQGAASQLSAESVGSVYNNYQGSWALLKGHLNDDTPLFTLKEPK